MKKYFENQSKRGQIPKEDCKAYFRWDKNGIITDLELHAGVCMGVSAEVCDYPAPKPQNIIKRSIEQ